MKFNFKRMESSHMTKFYSYDKSKTLAFYFQENINTGW